ncbi:MAG: DUF305 domain-containing protein [Spirochaetota bacterium]
MSHKRKIMIITGGIIVTSLIIASVVFFSTRGTQRIGPGMMEIMGASVESEYEYLVHMIPHHEEAVTAAKVVKDTTEREEMERFAEDIIRTQSEEIEQMAAWLEAWYPEKSHHIDYQPMMRDLENLSAERLDWAFLEDMIPHHMEAVMLSQQLLSRGMAEHEEVASLARSIRNNQRSEILMMRRWMSQWPDDVQKTGTNNRMFLWIGVIASLVFIVLVVLLVKVVLSGPATDGSSGKTAKRLLDIRYAKGEISREAYLDAQKDLEQ